MSLATRLPLCHDVMIIIDTNVIFAKGDDKNVNFIPQNRCLKFFENNNREIHFGRYYITESVKQEILQQKNEIIQGRKKKLENCCSYFNVDFPKIVYNAEKELDSFLKDNNISVLPLPSNERFPAIIKRAFKKLPPFKGLEGESDKGFKDVLLWESLLAYSYEKERIGRVVLITNNESDFNHKFLKEEFSELHRNIQLDIFNSWDKWEEENKNLALELITFNNLDYNSVLDLLKGRFSNVNKIISLKKHIQRADDFVAEVTAEIELDNGERVEKIYYFDVRNNEPMLDYQIDSNEENK